MNNEVQQKNLIIFNYYGKQSENASIYLKNMHIKSMLFIQDN